MERYDVAIAGGGPAGAAAAIVLARSGLRVLLAEQAPQRCALGEGLAPNARSLLQELGVLDAVAAGAHRASHASLSSWGRPELVAQDFVNGLHGHGWQLDRTAFDTMLRSAAAAAGAELAASSRLVLQDTTPQPHGLELHAAGATRRLSSRWLIDAGGRSAVLARRLGARRVATDRLLAFHCRATACDADDRDGSTLVEATPAGWWYSLLLPSRERLFVFLTDADGEQRRWLDPARFIHALTATHHLQALWQRHGYRLAAPPQGCDAASACLAPCTGPQWLAVGDAALSFDPLSARGIATALYTGLLGAQTLCAADAGDSAATTRYRQQLERIFATYRVQLAEIYAAETRWPEAPFWRRRQAPATAAVQI